MSKSTEIAEINLDTIKNAMTVTNNTISSIDALQKQFSEIPNGNTDQGYKELQVGVSSLKKIRVNIENERKKFKRPLIDAGKMVDGNSKLATSMVEQIEEPWKEAKTEIDDRERIMKEKRIKELRSKISDIQAVIPRCLGKESGYIAKEMERLHEVRHTDFYELASEAAIVLEDTKGQLDTIYSDRLSYERMKAEADERRAELERQRREMEVENKINQLRLVAAENAGKGSVELGYTIESMEATPPSESYFGSRYGAALDAYSRSLEMLKNYHEAALVIEEQERHEKEKAATVDAFEEEIEPVQLHSGDTTQEELQETANAIVEAISSQIDEELDAQPGSKAAMIVLDLMTDKQIAEVVRNFGTNVVAIMDADEYENMHEDSALLTALFSAGVDNWEGYEEALSEM